MRSVFSLRVWFAGWGGFLLGGSFWSSCTRFPSRARSEVEILLHYLETRECLNTFHGIG
jgi:hypothetical protein